MNERVSRTINDYLLCVRPGSLVMVAHRHYKKLKKKPNISYSVGGALITSHFLVEAGFVPVVIIAGDILAAMAILSAHPYARNPVYH